MQPPMPAPTPTPTFASTLRSVVDWVDVGTDLCEVDVGEGVEVASVVELGVTLSEVDEELIEGLLVVDEIEAVTPVGAVFGVFPS